MGLLFCLTTLGWFKKVEHRQIAVDATASREPAWAAARLNQPLQAFQTPSHDGALGRSFGFLSCNNSNVMVKALKKAENSAEIVVRLQELAGQAQTAQLTFASSILTARQVTGAEDPITSFNPTGGVLTVSLGAYQPLTLALILASSGSFVARPASVPVTLPFNLDAISTDGNRTDGNFDGGYTYPAELMPASIVQWNGGSRPTTFVSSVQLSAAITSADIAAAFGGQGSQTAFGPRSAANALTKATTWAAVIFMITSFTLAIMATRQAGASGSVLTGTPATNQAPVQTPAPASPAPAQK